MSYQLGIDLGTTFTAAAVYRDGHAGIEELGAHAASVPTVLFVRGDETLLTGDAANRRALTEPGRLAREFKRRVGDPTPVMLGGAPYSAEALMAKMLRWVVDSVAERQGGPPDRITVSHPANWGPYKRELLNQAIHLADLKDVETITEPEAAAIYYASNERVEEGAVVAVYDLGGGTFDAAVLRKSGSGFEILGEPEGIEHLGGIDFDQAIFAHVNQAVDGAVEQVNPKDATALKAAARLRQEIVEAKEALSSDTEASIPVVLPTVDTEVRLTRAEFEAMIRPTLSETIAALRRALRSAGVEPEQVWKVLLVGGSSRIPLVAQMVSADLGRPVAVDAHPKHAVPLGAAIAAATEAEGRPDLVPAAIGPLPEEPTGVHAAIPTEPLVTPSAVLPTTPAQGPPPTEKEPAPVSPKRKIPASTVAGIAVVLVALLAGGAFAFRNTLFGGGEDPAARARPRQAASPTAAPRSNTGAGAQQPQAHFQVTEASVAADPPSFEGTCPTTIEFIGHISAQGGGGQASYKFVFSDGNETGPETVGFSGPGTQEVSTSRTFDQSFDGSVTLQVLAPQQVQSDPASFEVSCL